MYSDLQGKTAIVTGASKGIGRAIAERFGRERMNVVVNYFSGSEEGEAAAEAVRRAGGQAIAVQADAADEAGVRLLVETAASLYGGLDVMVNNAGIQSFAPSHELSLEEWNRVIGVNLSGAFLGCREAIAHMLKRGACGAVLNVSSVHQIIPKPQHAHYASSKGGLKLLTETLALEYASRGIRVNAIAPGAIRTPMNRDILADPAVAEAVLRRIPLGAVGEPEHIAAAAAWLASAEAAYVTGITLVADGGMTLYP